MWDALRYVPLIGLYVEAERCTSEHREGVVEAVADVGEGTRLTFADGTCLIIVDRDDWMIAVYRRVAAYRRVPNGE